MDPAAVQDQIDRILQSETFAGKSQLMKLLEVLFDQMDTQATLKPDRVIRELWPEETRTKRSADVATEMNRLRKALECYYTTEGADDPITIGLPNRSVHAGNGAKEKRWIAAEPRGVIRGPTPASGSAASNAIPRGHLKLFAAVVSAAILAIVAFVTIRMLAAPDPPQSARLDGSTLIVMNAKGQDLWRKAFPDGFSLDYYSQGVALRMWLGDLDGDGHSEVLFLYELAGSQMQHSTTLICYSDRGKEKWRWTPGRVLPDLEGTPATFKTVALRVLKATPGQGRRVVVSSYHMPFYPDQIAILDASGKSIAEYWHSGHLDFLTLADLDGDGREEIIATGISNGYHEATLIVLDPDRVSGASTEAARPEIQLHGMGIPHERYRLLFPRSDVNMIFSSYNEAQEVIVEQGKTRLSVLECRQRPGCLIWYEFDKNFDLLSVMADDYFKGAHREFYLNTQADHPFTKEEEKEFQRVRCLVGCKTEYVPVEIH
jgi:hypothetical protein